MMNSIQLWSKRFGERMKEMLKFGRYMFNDHILIVLLISIGAGAYYYKDWVASLSEDFPTAFLFAVLFSFVLATGNIITFFKEADKVFLLAVETKLKRYIVRSFILTYVWHLYLLFMLLLVLAPIFFNTMSGNQSYVIFAVLIFVLKIINLFVRWFVDFDYDKQVVTWDVLTRICLNGISIFLFMQEAYILFAACIVIFLAYFVYFALKTKGKSLPWERLIDNEERRLGQFYRIANLFTDVPELRMEVKRRKGLDIFYKGIPFAQNSTYSYLISRTFFRSGDYFGLFIRLTLIGGVFIFGLDGSYLSYIIAILFIYLTGFQLLSMWKHHDYVIWTDLYPVSSDIQLQSFLKILLNILWTQNLFFTFLFLSSGEWIKGLILFIVSSVFVYLFVFVYCKNRLVKWSQN
ncbi:ABC transporter permease [Bacillus kwashiorkori]|uniref:ABC transporter permease n=1 Tax=Bacillus kwashiorkori TaxID=1522318 RepID=UPI000781C845|nr:ABC transporter permease [Bacillus kwashiorkori]